MKAPIAFALFWVVCIVNANGQLIGTCPPSVDWAAVDVKGLQGVVVDENLAVVQKVKVKLQVAEGGKFRDVALTETDPSGRFRFEAQHRGKYRFVFGGFMGFCPAKIPVRYSKKGLKGMRVTLPTAASDTCPDYCEGRLKIGEMTGREGHE